MSHASLPQAMVDQRPSFGRKKKKKGHNPNQVMGKTGIIRRDKRLSTKYY
jgi:hypothetical protein